MNLMNYGGLAAICLLMGAGIGIVANSVSTGNANLTELMTKNDSITAPVKTVPVEQVPYFHQISVAYQENNYASTNYDYRVFRIGNRTVECITFNGYNRGGLDCNWDGEVK